MSFTTNGTPQKGKGTISQGSGIRYRLLLVEALVFLIPAAGMFYLLWGKQAFFDLSHFMILIFLLVMILGGFLLLRQILDTVSAIARWTQRIESGEIVRLDLDPKEKELREISSSISNLLKNLERRTEEANRRLVELLSIKEFAEAVRREKEQAGLLTLLLEKTVQLTGARCGWVCAPAQGGGLEYLARRSEPGAGKKDLPGGVWEQLCRDLEANGRPVFLAQDHGTPRVLSSADSIQHADFLAMPVIRDPRPPAMLVLSGAGREEGFTLHDSYVLSIMTGQIALGYERRGLHRELSRRIEELKRRTDELETEVVHRKEAEVEAKGANVFLRGILESSSSISIISTDRSGNILYWNKGAENIFGYKAWEMVGKKKIDVLYGDDEQTARVIEETRALVLGQKRKLTCEVREIAKDGRKIWVRLNLTSRRDESGKVVGILGIGEDITERKRLEQKLLQAEKLKAIGTLAGGIAHDFNNILAGIVAYTEAARFELGNASKVRQCLDQVLKASHRAKDLVRQILDFSRQASRERKPIPLAPVIREAVKLLRGVLPAAIQIQESIDPDAGVVSADATQVHQVIMNLVTNASQAMWEHGGKLSVTLSNVEFSENQPLPDPDLEPGPYVVLSVTDTGCGMEAQVMERIFEPYYTTKARGEGSGMGLSVVYGVVKSHGGGISVKSRPGEGTTFEIYWPRVYEPAADQKGDVLSGLPGGKEHVLFVDDDESITGSVKLVLEFLGYKVTALSSSVDALDLFMSDPHGFDAVITDQTMPKLTGVELIKSMQGVRPELPVILCTGYSQSLDPAKARELGVSGFLMKPVQSRDLAELLRQVLDAETARGAVQ
ncbi:MAG: PAS domain S-box protein [Deltaproteobacteria bacterium]|nr:PAS domain S-box protein [Deltaproteobacteria bacterium]